MTMGLTEKLTALAVCAVLAVACTPAPDEAADNPSPGIRVYTANVITMAPSQPRAEAVALQDGRIIAVGSLEAIQSELAGGGAVVDRQFSHKTLLPGFIDNHLHPSMAAVLLPMTFITPYDWQLADRDVVGVLGQEPYRARLIEAEAAIADPAQWMFTWGYHPYFHGTMSRAYLDTVSAARPIVVWHRSFHEVFANSAAISAMGVSQAQAAAHPHIDLARGHFYETALPVVFESLGPQILAPERFGAGMQLLRDTVHRGGITTIADMAAGIFDLQLEWPALKAVLDTPATPFRTLLVPFAPSLSPLPGDAEGVAAIEQLMERNSDKLFFVRQVKLLADGAFYSQLMQMGEPGYLDGHHGEWLMEPAVLEFAARAFWAAGYQIHVHSNGDLGTDLVLDILERLRGDFPRDDHRFTLHHVGYSTHAQSTRMAALGALVSANPYYLYALGDKYAEVGLGPERASHIFRGASFVEAGVPLSLHSDFTMAPASPLTLAWVAVNRLAASGNVLAPDLRLTVEQALRAITIDAAFAIRMEQEIGSIEVGKRADFTVLEQDPYTVRPQQLKDIDVWGTVFEGELHPLHVRATQ